MEEAPTLDETNKQWESKNKNIYKTNSNLQQGVFSCFSRGSNREMFTDFTVVVEDVEFKCHRFVLNACSEFFEALLRSDMKERRNMRATIHDISPTIFGLILDVIYSGSDVVTQENMMEMWKASHQLQIDFLLSECEDFVLKNLNSENCYTVYNTAQLLQSAKVIHFVLNYMVENFFCVATSQNFINIQYEDLLQILQNKQLPVCVDFQVEAILRWCDSESEDRTKHQARTRTNFNDVYSEDFQTFSHLKIPASKYQKKKPNHLSLGKSRNQVFLGNLLQVVDLSKVSKQCLATLLKNTSIQENKQAVALVNAQAATSLFHHQPDYNYKQRMPNDHYHDKKFKGKYKAGFAAYQYPEDKIKPCCPHCQ